MPAPHTLSQEPVRFSCWSSDLAWNGPNLLKECELIQWNWHFFGNYLAWVDIRIVLYDLEFFHSILIFCQWSLLKARISGFHANFHFAALTSPLQLLLVLCPPPLSFEIAWSAFYWLVVSVAPQIEHMFDLGSTRSTPLKYRAPVATWDRLHI